jgi:hypothetical protein
LTVNELVNDYRKLAAIESVATSVIQPQSLPGIDISPLIDALMQFLLQLLDDCPEQKIRDAAEQSQRRPVMRMFWRMQLKRRLPSQLAELPDMAANLLEAGAKLTDEQWAAVR